MTRLHVATGHGAPGWFHDEAGLPAAFAKHGIHATPAHWRDIPADGTPVVIRTAWDYTQHRDGFLAWLDALDAAGSPVCNGTDTLRWNLDKRYLLELESKGHAVVPTQIAQTIDDALALAGDNHCIAKPVIGGGAEGLHILRGGKAALVTAEGNAWGEAAHQGPYMVQPFLESIRDGEWSLFYFGGDYSHAILKTPAQGDIRVQEEHGGTTQAATPPPFVREAADRLVHDVDAVQVRVDGVVHEGQFLLMELEMIEPELYFRATKGGEERFAAAVAAALGPS